MSAGRGAPPSLLAAQGLVQWLDVYGPFSYDLYDWWASAPGRHAKKAYYQHPIPGLALVLPLALADNLCQPARSLIWHKTRFPIADAHYAMGFFNLAVSQDEVRWIDRGRGLLKDLLASRSPGLQNCCWGYPFDWETCFGTFKAGTPLITTAPYVYEAFEQGYEATGDTSYLATMHSIARFAHEDLVDQEVGSSAFACSYGPFDRRRVVNASAYRAFLLTTAGLRFAREDWLAAARGNVAFVLQSQQPDGSWFYAMDGKDRFVDNFHTCFVVKNLVKVWTRAGDEAVLEAARRGYEFYKSRLLDDQGLPIPFARTQRPNLVRRELYDLAEGINLALLMRGIDPDAPRVLHGLLDHLLRAWALPDGHFVTRITWFGRDTMPYHRWAQAQTFRALTEVCLQGV